MHELWTDALNKTPSSKGRGSLVLKEESFTSATIGLENTLEWLEEYDLPFEFTLHEMFATGTVGKAHLLAISKNDVELITNVLLWTPAELAKQYLILPLETVKFWEKDLLADVEIEIEWELEHLEIKDWSVSFNFSKLFSRVEKLSAIILKVEDLLTIGFSNTFIKSTAKLSKELFANKSCFQKWCIE